MKRTSKTSLADGTAMSSEKSEKFCKPKCPETFTTEFGRQLIGWLGGNVSIIRNNWCWRDFATAFFAFRSQVEQYFAEATVGNPADAAYWMCWRCGSSREWAERVIEQAKTGDPAQAAYWMWKCCGSSQEWAESVNVKYERTQG